MSRLLTVGFVLVGLSLAASVAAFVSTDRQRERTKRLQESLRQAGVQVNAESDEPPAGIPGKLALSETDYDFGRVSPQAKVKHAFEIRNDGAGILTLKVAERSCTCILGQLKRDKLAPGETTTLELALKSEGKEGQIVQGVTLETNDPDRRFISLRLLGELRQEVWADQSSVSFIDLAPGEVRTVPIHIYSVWPEGFSVDDVTSRPAKLQAEWVPMNDAALQTAEAASGVVLNVTCPAQVHDFFLGRLSLKVRRNDSQQVEQYSFDVDGNRLGLIGVFGEPLDELGRMKAGNIERGAGRTIVYSVKARGRDKKLKLKNLRRWPEFLDVQIQPTTSVSQSGLHKLIVTIPAGAPEGSYQGVDAGKIELDFEGEYPGLVFKVEFAVVEEANDR